MQTIKRRLARCSVLFSLAVACSAPAEVSDVEATDIAPADGDEALAILLEGNRRFVEGSHSHQHETLRRRMLLEDGQKPFAAILGCADSRVIPELLFDMGLGDIFVIRVAGNVVADDEAGSLEYAIDHLDVPLVLVLGHEGCGAVTAALTMPEGESEELASLLKRLEPAVEGIDPALPLEERVHLGVEANVRYALDRLQAIVAREVGELRPGRRIAGAVYELETGRVRILED